MKNNGFIKFFKFQIFLNNVINIINKSRHYNIAIFVPVKIPIESLEHMHS
jgi:hypothetical protein